MFNFLTPQTEGSFYSNSESSESQHWYVNYAVTAEHCFIASVDDTEIVTVTDDKLHRHNLGNSSVYSQFVNCEIVDQQSPDTKIRTNKKETNRLSPAVQF